MSMLKQYKYQICVSVLFLLMLFLHLFRLEGLPLSINIDEAGLWYNVKSLLANGYDQGGNTWPLLFVNYYSEQSSMYTYLALICVKLFGDTLFAIRLPAVLNACLIFIFGAKVTKKLFKSNLSVELFCVCSTIFPYFIVNNRIALDCNLMLGFSTVFLYFLILAIDTSKWQHYLIAGIWGGIVFYTYALSYITIPVFVCITGIYLIIYKKINLKNSLLFVLPIIILGIPLLLIQLINIFELNEMYIGAITLTNFETSRHTSVGFGNIIGHIIFFINYIFVSEEISQFTSLIFCNNFYLPSILFLCFGVANIVKTKGFSLKKVILFWLTAMFVTFLFIKTGIRGYQANAFMFGFVICILDGLFGLFDKIQKQKIKKLLIVMLILAYVFSFGGFIYHYFCGEYNNNMYLYENTDDEISEILEYVKNDEKVYFALLSVYYKLEMNKDTVSNPFEFDYVYDAEQNDMVYKEKIYIDDKFIFDYLGKFLENVDVNATYVVPERESEIINELNQYPEFNRTQINRYVIFRKE